MKRDWIGELEYTTSEISLESGVPERTIRAYVGGKLPFNTKSPHYNAIRNVNRKLAGRELRAKGATPKQSSDHKSTYFHPKKVPKRVESTRIIKKKVPTEGKKYFRLRILGEFQNDKTEEARIQEGWSKLHPFPDYLRDEEEAIAYAQKELSGTNWKLKKLLEQGYETTIETAYTEGV